MKEQFASNLCDYIYDVYGVASYVCEGNSSKLDDAFKGYGIVIDISKNNNILKLIDTFKYSRTKYHKNNVVAVDVIY